MSEISSKPMTQKARREMMQRSDAVGGYRIEFYGTSGRPEITTEGPFLTHEQAERLREVWTEILTENREIRDRRKSDPSPAAAGD